MRQVPLKYLLIGSGRVSKHIGYYFDLLKIPYQNWNRQEHSPTELQQQVLKSTHILLAVSDQALESLEQQILSFASPAKPSLFHFSGATSLKHSTALHPLMSFGPELYDFETYKKIQFVAFCDSHPGSFLPGLENPVTVLPVAQQAYYHSLCVMGGNFPVLLWHKMESEFAKLSIPTSASHLYLQQVLTNYLKHSNQALTGPLVRKDHATIEKNLSALKDDDYQIVYEAFRKVYQDANQS